MAPKETYISSPLTVLNSMLLVLFYSLGQEEADTGDITIARPFFFYLLLLTVRTSRVIMAL